jgi:EAL domain-containing protein (putative c-di-GMP-specific phosphodiesterase class I)/cellobiose-specific phosphotransferase system component IIC
MKGKQGGRAVKRVFANEKFLSFVTTMQEAFSAVIPFFLLSSFVTLLYYLVSHFAPDTWFPVIHLQNLMKDFNSFSSLVAAVAIAYFFARRYRTDSVIALILSVAVLITVFHIEAPDSTLVLPSGFTPAALIMPIVSTYLLKMFYPYLVLPIPIRDGHQHIYRFFSYVFVFAFAYLAAVLLYVGADWILDDAVDRINRAAEGIPGILRLAVREFFVQLFWFFGIHGAHVVNGLSGKEILTEPMMAGLTYGEFRRLFISIGGAGVGMALIGALVLHARNKGILWFLTKLSAPFVLFNINTLLIYGAVVLNRVLLIPFLLLPLFNLVAAYLFLRLVPVTFTDYSVTWITPVFVDAYLKSGGDWTLVMFQMMLLAVDIRIYSLYVRRYVALSTSEILAKRLEERLDLPEEIRSREHIRSYAAHWEVMEANSRLEKILEGIDRNRLTLYYQPKVDPATGRCDSFEALIRHEKEGRMVGPDFLEDLERVGMAPVIDRWVAYRVLEDLERWSAEGWKPAISINLHPDTVRSREEIVAITRILEGWRITFEIIERSFLDFADAEKTLVFLRERGYGIAIDDFGSGYSSLETITRYRIDELKLDKSLIDLVETRKGYLVCKHTASLCRELGCRVVAEGVERPEQLERLKEVEVDLVQGYLYSPAVPAEDLRRLCRSLEDGSVPVD